MQDFGSTIDLPYILCFVWKSEILNMNGGTMNILSYASTLLMLQMTSARYESQSSTAKAMSEQHVTIDYCSIISYCHQLPLYHFTSNTTALHSLLLTCVLNRNPEHKN